MTLRRALGFAIAWLVLVALGAKALAQPLVTLEASAGTAVTKPQTQLFGPGAAGAAAVYLRLAPWVLLGAKLRGGLLSNGDAPSDLGRVNPSLGTFETLAALIRLRPFAKAGEVRSAVGLFVEGGGGGAVTGKLVRPAFEAGLGWGFALGSVALAPTLRYLQVLQPSDPLSGADARVVLLGAELAVLDARPRSLTTSAAEPVPEAKADRDQDGVPDERDACPDTPEDRDGYEDQDGCPDPDNDGDKIPDAKDSCPNQAEDIDNFEDQDGCPDPDNDHDGFLDADDQCPNEAEIVNGNKDYDGCPDEGLIEFHNDRIVLEERVLFDFERARVKSAARPILSAIVNLYKLHPEWMKIRIEGHADQRGKEEYNQELSQERADNVRKELVKLGIPEAMIEATGYGSTRPRDLRQEEDAFHRNRRVEFVVVGQGAGLAGAAAATPSESTPEASPQAPAKAKPGAAAPKHDASDSTTPEADVPTPPPAPGGKQ